METGIAVRVLAALAQDARLEIFRLLVRVGLKGMPAGEIGKSLHIPSATLSFHLKELKNAGIVKCKRSGRSLIYSPDFGAMNALLDFLTESCCQGTAAAGRQCKEERQETMA